MASLHMKQDNLSESRQRVDVRVKNPCKYESYALDWSLEEFTDELLHGKFSNLQTMFRVGVSPFSPSSSSSSSISNHDNKTIRECESMHIQASFHQFNSWLSAGDNTEAGKKLGLFHDLPSFSEHKVFAYADYKHFVELFANEGDSDVDVDGDDESDEKCIPRFGDWQGVGLEGIDSSQCTLWLGSLGSHTVFSL